MPFQGADIYSLISGMYPILSDDVETGYSQSREVRQNIASAPSIYNITTATKYDPRQFLGSTSFPRKPYLQGNKISFTKATDEDDLGTISNMVEQGLFRDVAPSFATRTSLMQMQAHMTIMGAMQNRVGLQQAAIDSRAKSMEEQTQTGEMQSTAGMSETEYGETLGAQRIDLYDPIRNVYVNVTNQMQQSLGHGIYGNLGKNMHAHITQIDADFRAGDITEEQKYDAIVNEGISYFKSRAADTWNPIIRHAMNLTLSGITAGYVLPNSASTRSAASRELQQIRGTVGSFDEASGFRAVQSMQGGVTNYASESARKMTKQHLGNPSQFFGGGIMETYVIGPYTFAEYGPFRGHPAGHPQQYQYRVNQIDGSWFQNYFASSMQRGNTGAIFDAERDARLRAAAFTVNTHGGERNAAAIGGSTTVGIGGFTMQAHRLYPEINLHNANAQFSERIGDLIRSMQNQDTMPIELSSIVEQHQSRFSNLWYGGKEVWAGPYISLISPMYASNPLTTV